jgi:biotin carboxylase
MARVIILGAGVDSVHIIKRIRDLGHEVWAVDQDVRAPGFAVATAAVLASCYDPRATLEALGALERPPEAVLCGGVDAPEVESAVAERYGLVGPSRATAMLAKHKADQWVALKGAGVPVPEMAVVDTLDDVGPGKFPWGYPWQVVVKPSVGRGARRVYRVPSYDWPRLWLAIQAAGPSPVIVQGWLDGRQLSTETLIQNGKALWTSVAERNYDRLPVTSPNVIEDGSDMPVPWDYDNRNAHERIHEVVALCAKAIGLDNGTLKGDLVWRGDAYVVEVAPRLSGGSFCSILTPVCYGVDFVRHALDIALGREVEHIVPTAVPSHVCQRFQFPYPYVTSHPQRGPWVLGQGNSREAARKDAKRRLAEHTWQT